MAIPLKEILHILEAHYPAAWAVAGDKVGLALGDPEAPVDLILVALEATPRVVAEAKQRGAQLLLTHHPLLYQPLQEVRQDQPAGLLLAALVRAGINLASCHTNLDVAPDGLNDHLARLLELTGVAPLSETGRELYYKLAVFVPLGYEDRVRQALGDLGLGTIGRYSHCSFASRGQGTYLPLAGAHPFRGEEAKLARAPESRLELLAPEPLLAAALTRLREVHPYEEVAYDVYPLKNPGPPLGFGRIGEWPESKPFSQVVARVKELFGVETVRVWGRPPLEVQRVAVCGGSGGDLLPAALAQGVQLYVTGEVRHHQVPPGGGSLAVLELGHFASEVVFMKPWARRLQELFREAGLTVEIEAAAEQAPPFSYL
jgi:dinuclear metal center YbgI/SA1388 family protein